MEQVSKINQEKTVKNIAVAYGFEKFEFSYNLLTDLLDLLWSDLVNVSNRHYKVALYCDYFAVRRFRNEFYAITIDDLSGSVQVPNL